jgi:hypothetical protein
MLAQAVLRLHPGHETASELLAKVSAPTWLWNTPVRAAACIDDTTTLSALLMEADDADDYASVHQPDENGKPPMAAAATAANASPCDSMIM